MIYLLLCGPPVSAAVFSPHILERTPSALMNCCMSRRPLKRFWKALNAFRVTVKSLRPHNVADATEHRAQVCWRSHVGYDDCYLVRRIRLKYSQGSRGWQFPKKWLQTQYVLFPIPPSRALLEELDGQGSLCVPYCRACSPPRAGMSFLTEHPISETGRFPVPRPSCFTTTLQNRGN